jgi:bifunctional N-acetylglucosamine-1-phosphate-uridyltransferase/glucosamine-1-phosphate-acetyltransferase GlmU-like protein
MIEAVQAKAQEPAVREAHTGLKAVILAAGKQAITPDGRPLVLEPLGERSILQCVVDNALGVVRPEDIYIVVGYRQDDVYAHLGPKFNYVVQPEALGTGHAMATLRSSGPTPFADCSTATS